MKLLYIALLLGPLLSGCSSMVTNIPVSMAESSEVNGEQSHDVKLEITQIKMIDIGSDVFGSPPNLRTSTINKDSTKTLSGSLELGLGERFSVSAKEYFNSPFFIIGKYQFQGQNKLNSKEGNLSASIFLGLGGASYQKEDKGFFDSSVVKSHGNTGDVIAGLSIGYKLKENLLFYISPSFYSASFKGKIEQISKNNFYKYSGGANGETISLGILIETENNSELFAEGFYSKCRSTSGDKDIDININAGIKFFIKNISKNNK